MTKSDGGKGSDRRPGQGYGDGWERIFGGKSEPTLEHAQENVPIPKPISELADSKTCRFDLPQT